MLTFFMLSLKQSGKDIDVYLAPLVDDLKILWNDSVEMYDTYRQETFTLKALLLWTINDFSTYGNMCGCTVKGHFSYPICGERTFSEILKHSKKIPFAFYKRFLPRHHLYRKQKMAFNGNDELDMALAPLSGEIFLLKLNGKRFIMRKKKVKTYSKS